MFFTTEMSWESTIAFALPPQVNHLGDFPLDLDKEAVYGHAANCILASHMHLPPFSCLAVFCLSRIQTGD